MDQSSRKQTGISGFILAGGKSSRLHQDKVLLPWNGRTLLTHTIERLQAVTSTVRICADRQDLAQYLPQSSNSIRDALPNTGPLGGIVAALSQSRTLWNFFLAVDLPLLPVELLRALANQAQSAEAEHPGTLCILPQIDGRPQPLCGLYHRSLKDGLHGALQERKYKLLLALQDAICAIEDRPNPSPETPASPVKLFDAQSFAATIGSKVEAGDWFLNINTPQDLQRARELNSAQFE